MEEKPEVLLPLLPRLILPIFWHCQVVFYVCELLLDVLNLSISVIFDAPDQLVDEDAARIVSMSNDILTSVFGIARHL